MYNAFNYDFKLNIFGSYDFSKNRYIVYFMHFVIAVKCTKFKKRLPKKTGEKCAYLCATSEKSEFQF